MAALAPPSTLRLTLILGTLSAVGPLSIDMYLPGLPTIAHDLKTDSAAVGLTLSLFFMGLALGQACYGPLADRYGRRRPLLIGWSLYAIASAGCALAPSIAVLIALRVVQALGACAGMVIARSVVRDCCDERGAARLFSFLMLVSGLAPITAPLIGGQLLVTMGWRAIFWLLAGFGLLCFALVALGLPETLPPERRNRNGLGRALAVYGQLLANRRFMGTTLAGGFVFAGMFAYIAGSPFVFIELYGVAPERYGWLFGTNALGLVLAAQLNGWLLRYLASTTILVRTLYLSAAAGLLLALVAATAVGGLWGLLPLLFVYVASVGIVSPNTAAMALAPHGRIAGSAAALLGTLQFIVGAIAGALVGALHDGTALPMAGVIASCGLAALLSYQLLVARPVAAVSQHVP